MKALIILFMTAIPGIAVLADDCGVYERDMQVELAERGYVNEASEADYECASELAGNKTKLTVTVSGNKEIMYCDSKGCN